MVGNSDVMVGSNDNSAAFGQESTVPSLGPTEVDGAIANNPGVEQTTLPVSLRLGNVRGYNIHITVECQPTDSTLMNWRIATYEKIAQAYFAMKKRYDDEAAAAKMRSGLTIEGGSSERNLQIIRQELKKHMMAMLFQSPNTSSTTPFGWPRLITEDAQSREPSILAEEAVARAPFIQFLEQAFEWEKLTYVCYPYFWADRATQWPTLAALENADPLLGEFLRAGSARTVVSVRPGFEAQVQMFLEFGIIWGGNAPPAPGEDEYLSVADEIKSIQMGPDDAEALEWWDKRLPTSLLYLEGAAALPVKPEDQRELGSPAITISH
jgi:hypothetical protein